MTTITATTFVATVSAGSASEAAAKLSRFIGPDATSRFALNDFALTGRVSCRSERHRLWNVEVVNHGGNVNDAWVILTSFGVTPCDGLNSTWQKVSGVGC